MSYFYTLDYKVSHSLSRSDSPTVYPSLSLCLSVSLSLSKTPFLFKPNLTEWVVWQVKTEQMDLGGNHCDLSQLEDFGLLVYMECCYYTHHISVVSAE